MSFRRRTWLGLALCNRASDKVREADYCSETFSNLAMCCPRRSAGSPQRSLRGAAPILAREKVTYCCTIDAASGAVIQHHRRPLSAGWSRSRTLRRVKLARHDPLPPVVNDRYKASKIANFPKNEYWR